ncbi:threonine ammonia-lyase [Paenibacillus wulumuqiensis]|uniref:threonine ammonia-lyase n=1 Tax=Paenibacillus wulumuqiensis TaxID=1567107 RepID=UPI00061915A9|nr:threonine/serine dehydratase [Paenibacillus wulumuqiensis]
MEFTVAQIQAAQSVLHRHTKETPVQTSELLNRLTGKNVWLKPEFNQYTGSFKYRGAFNFLASLDRSQYRGVIAGSSGNHGIAVSSIAGRMGIPATVCMAEDASLYKRKTILHQGAEVVSFNRMLQNREEVVKGIAEEYQLCMIPSANHPLIMAGAGTIALEMLSDVDEPVLDAIIVPVGGGGLASGVALAAHHVHPNIRIIGVEPAAANDASLSIKAGRIVTIDTPQTLADGLCHSHIEKLPFRIMQEQLEDIVTVTEQQIEYALELAHTRLDLAIEPTSAVVIAALLFADLPRHWRHIGIVLTGANMDPSVYPSLPNHIMQSSAVH